MYYCVLAPSATDAVDASLCFAFSCRRRSGCSYSAICSLKSCSNMSWSEGVIRFRMVAVKPHASLDPSKFTLVSRTSRRRVDSRPPSPPGAGDPPHQVHARQGGPRRAASMAACALSSAEARTKLTGATAVPPPHPAFPAPFTSALPSPSAPFRRRRLPTFVFAPLPSPRSFS